MEGQLPEDELWELLCIAHQQYQSHIIRGHKAYQRFVNDLISYHIYIRSSDEQIIRSHIQNISWLHELLSDRTDLVEEFFSKDSFTKDDYVQMKYQFNTSGTTLSSKAMAKFNDNQLCLITDFCNQNNYFAQTVHIDEMRNFFLCKLSKPLVANNTVPVLFMLNAMQYAKLLRHGWKQRIADHNLLVPRRTMQSMSANALRHRLSESLHQLDSPIQSPYGRLIKQLKEKM